MEYQAISPSGALIRLDNEYKGVLKTLLEVQHELAKNESNRKTYEAQEAKKFEYEDKLAKMQAELAEVERRCKKVKFPIRHPITMWRRNYRKWKVKRPRPPSQLTTIMHG